MLQIRLFCHQLYERMRAVQQSMTMAMAVNMAHSSSTGFATPVESGSSTQCASTTLMPGNHASRYPPPPQQPTSHSNTGSTVSSIRHSRKRRANSNAIER